MLLVAGGVWYCWPEAPASVRALNCDAGPRYMYLPDWLPADKVRLPNRPKLAELDVSAYTNLYFLDCSDNVLTALDLTANTRLRMLDCTGNRLTSLDVSANTQLFVLGCGNNPLTEIVVADTNALPETFGCPPGTVVREARPPASRRSPEGGEGG